MKTVVCFVVSAILLAGCVTKTAPINLACDGYPKDLIKAKTPYNCKVTVAEVEDLRPIEEVKEHDQCKVRYVVPLLLYNQWSSAGPEYMDNKLYDSVDVKHGLGSLMQKVLDESHAFSEGGREYLIHTKVKHLYSVRYKKDFSIVGYGAAFIDTYEFFPCGYVELDLTLVDKVSGDKIGEKTITHSFLYNHEHSELSSEHTANGGLVHKDGNDKGVILIAIREAMKDLVQAVDCMIACKEGVCEIKGLPECFSVIRLTDEYDFCEEICVESETGRIINNKVRKYNAPYISRPGEWVVLPVDDKGHWMAMEQYQKMIALLSEKYEVGFGDNLDAAYFKGIKNSGM